MTDSTAAIKNSVVLGTQRSQLNKNRNLDLKKTGLIFFVNE